ncbi:TraB/GumN family protein [Salmonella enterica subsp. diarizonae]|nr:TraB/GumN family protein [Salmonella enterica subsp. diarizonae]
MIGSTHLGVTGIPPVPATLIDQVKKANALITEVNTDDGPEINQQETILPLSKASPDNLARVLTKDELSKLRMICMALNIDCNKLGRMSFWQVGILLDQKQVRLLGFTHKDNIDSLLIHLARQNNKRIISLEDQHTVSSLFKKLSEPDTGANFLRDNILYRTSHIQMIRKTMNLWLNNLPEKVDDIPYAIHSDEIGNLILHDRNKRWSQKLKTLPEGNYVVVVGVAHLIGPDNLITELQKTNS